MRELRSWFNGVLRMLRFTTLSNVYGVWRWILQRLSDRRLRTGGAIVTVQLKELDQIQDTMGKRLRSFRKDYGLTLAALASRTDLSVSYLSDLERGQTMPSIVSLMRIAEAYDARLNVKFEFESGGIGTVYYDP